MQKECVALMKRILSDNHHTDPWMLSRCCKLLANCLTQLNEVVESEIYKLMEFTFLETLVQGGTRTIAVFHRLAACYVDRGQFGKGRALLLSASVLSLKCGRIGAGLALDCTRVLRRQPLKAAHLLIKCGFRTPEVLFELCRCYMSLSNVKKLCRIGV